VPATDISARYRRGMRADLTKRTLPALALGILALPLNPLTATEAKAETKAEAACPIGVAHRGRVTDTQPENSLPAFKDAWKYMTWAETDIRFSRASSSNPHGVPILMHDATLNRTTNGKGNVSSLYSAQFVALRMKSRTGAVTRIHPPTMAQALQAAKSTNKYMLLETKTRINAAQAREITRRIISAGMLGKVRMQSFNAADLRQIKAVEPRLAGGLALLTYGQPTSSAHPYAAPKATAMTKAATDQLQAKGIKVTPWTVDDQNAWPKLKSWRVDAIITDLVWTYAKWRSANC
jgi:glycerophosphoryl diester phosphodiesterase